MRVCRAVIVRLATVALAALTPQVARAAGDLKTFNIVGAPIDEALLELALQAGLSIGRPGGLTCSGARVTLRGRYTVRAALQRMLIHSTCGFILTESQTVSIVRARPVAARRPKHAVPSALDLSHPPAPVAEVVVTASRRPERLDRTPYSLSRLSGAEIENAGVTDAAGVSSLIPGMTVTNLGVGRDKILLRGLSDGVLTGRTQSTVGIYLDDVPVAYNAPDPDLLLVDVADVEVLRGPQGTLYGSGSIGGIYQVVSRQPDLARYSVDVAASAADTASGSPDTLVEGVVNAPLLSDRLAVRVVAYAERSGGYIDDVHIGQDDINSTTRTGVRGALRLALNQRWTITVGGVGQSINAADTQYAVVGLGALQRANTVKEPHDNDFTDLFATLEGSGDGWRLKSSSALIRHQIDSRYDATSSNLSFSLPSSLPTAFDETDRSRLSIEDLYLASPAHLRVKWLAGVFLLRDDETNQFDLSDAFPGAVSALRPGYNEIRADRIDELALYGEATYPLSSKLFLTSGLRLFQSTLRTQSAIEEGSSTVKIDDEVRSAGVAPKIVIGYSLSQSLTAYAQATEGYRSGGANTSGLGTSSAPSFVPQRRYGGDNIWNYEIGAKASLFEDRVHLRTAAFIDVWDNIESEQIQPSGLPYAANIGDGLNKGLEVELAAAPIAGLTLRAHALFNNPELTKRNAAFPTPPDASLPGIADVTAGGVARFERPVAGNLTAFAQVQANYIGRSTISFDPTNTVAYGDYTTGRVAIGITASCWRITGFVDNPVNTVGDTFAFGNPFSVRVQRQTTPLRPRTIGLRLESSF